MAVSTAGGLRERARAARAAQVAQLAEQEAEARRERIVRLTVTLVERLGVEPGEMGGDATESARVTTGGLAFELDRHEGGPCLVGECPACHHEALSNPISDLAGLGTLLERFKPGYFHRLDCPARRPLVSPAERLVEAAVEALREALDDGGRP